MIVLAIPVSHVFNILFSVLSFKVKTLILTPIMMCLGFLIIEVIDEFFLDWEKTIDRIRRVVVPIMALFALAMIVIVAKNPDRFVEPIKEWRSSVNEKMQSRPTLVFITPIEGLNWRFLYEKPGALSHLTRAAASANCRGMGVNWQLYDGDKTFVANPKLTFSKSFHVWMNFQGAQLEKTGIAPPKAFVSAEPESKFPVLCINKKGSSNL